jgi:hypothetical protein
MLVQPSRCHHLVRWQRNDPPGLVTLKKLRQSTKAPGPRLATLGRPPLQIHETQNL